MQNESWWYSYQREKAGYCFWGENCKKQLGIWEAVAKRGMKMLEKVILVISDYYKEKLNTLPEYDAFVKEMDAHRTMTEVVLAQDMKAWLKGEAEFVNKRVNKKETCLILSDDKEILSFFQEKGWFTIALYHENVKESLSGTKYAIEGIEGIEWEYFYKVYQRFMGEPWHITDTKRCLIREMGVQDLDDLYELYSYPEVTRYTEGLFSQKEQEKQYIEDYIQCVYEYYGFGTWLIFRKEDGKLIGRAGFNYRPGFEEAELGFVIGYPYWRKGYAYEVCKHILEIGKSAYDLEKVQALAEKENIASIQLLKKLGFIYIEDIVLEGRAYQRYLHS